MSNLIDRDEVLKLLNIVRQDPSQIDNAIDDILSLPLQQQGEDSRIIGILENIKLDYQAANEVADYVCNEKISRQYQQEVQIIDMFLKRIKSELNLPPNN